MPATTSEPKTKKPPKLFSVTGDASGTKVKLSDSAVTALAKAANVLAALEKSAAIFPRAGDIGRMVAAFVMSPTMAFDAEKKQP